jgi:hypothetical protein
MSFKGMLNVNGEEFLYPGHSEWYRVENLYALFFTDDALTQRDDNYPIGKERGPSGAAFVDLTNTKENNKIFNLINEIHNEKVGATTQDIKNITVAVNSLANRSFTDLLFEKSLHQGSNISNAVMDLFSKNPQAQALLIVDGIREIKIENNSGIKTIQTSRVKFDDLHPEIASWMRNNILKLAEEGKLDEALGKLPAEIVKQNYSFAAYKEEMSKRVNSLIRDVDSPTRLLGFTKNFYETYINLSEIEEDGTKMYHLSEFIYTDNEFTKVPAAAIDAYSDLKGLFEYSNVFNYPLTIIRDQNNDEVEHVKEDLRNFSTLNGTNISDYPFLFLKSTSVAKNMFGQVKADLMSDGWFLGPLKWFYDRQTPAQFISKNISQNYFTFIRSLAEDIFDNSKLTQTIGTKFEEALSPKLVKPIFDLIAFDKIVAAKKAFFDRLAVEASDADDTPGELTEEEIEAAFKAQLETFKEGKPPDLPPSPSEEDIENRQKYFKQCALMLNLSKLRDTYQEKLNKQYSNKLPYDGRFTTLYCKDKEQELLLTRLVSSKNEQKLFELETHKISKLVPKIRLFKVFNSTDGGEKEVEFIFDRTSKQRDSFMSATFDKGNGVGLKNFSFEFNGTSPATARNDITASLTLFFQSFEDFTRTRTGYSDKYRYVDLVIQPTPDKQGEVGGIEILSDRQYEPQFYRIRADVGYVLPTEADGFTSDEITAIRYQTNHSSSTW